MVGDSKEQLEAQHLVYITVGCLAVILWDTVTNLRVDYLRLSVARFSIPTISFILIRISTICLLLSETMFLTAPVSDCGFLSRFVTYTFAVYGTSLHLLLFCRLRAIYLDSPWIVRAFFVLWLSILGLHFGLAPLLVRASHIPGSPYCQYTAVHLKYGQALLIAVTFNANAISLAVSYCLLTTFSFGESMSDLEPKPESRYSRFAMIRHYLSGANLPTFSRALYEDGQFHYFVMNTANIGLLIAISINKIPVSYRTGCLFPQVVVNSCTVCYVYRSIGSARYVSEGPSNMISTIRFFSPRRTETGKSQQESEV
ncbi:hypothetical protein PM082_021832 [Marasmius tenuissimus]|nr:hypothetical protein PM082_021832 [Marasmius tenuissimus]